MNNPRTSDIISIAEKAERASKDISHLTAEEKNTILERMAAALDNGRSDILKANAIDIKKAKEQGIRESLIDRLLLNDRRIDQMIESIKIIAEQKDCVGEIIDKKTLKSGLILTEKRVGFGVIAVIYESRPNVTTDVSALCLKSSSAAILKGGSDAENTNNALVIIISKACPIDGAFQLVTSTSRETTKELLRLNRHIDLVIPRGGKNLIDFVRVNSRIPVIETGAGNCHIYVDEGADIDPAIRIIINAKTQRPGVCNAAEKLLVHEKIAVTLLSKLKPELESRKVEIRGCVETQKIIDCVPAKEEDWNTEYLDLILAIKVVQTTDEAISHINRYGTRHSEAIISRNQANIDRFMSDVDAAAVYSNASTRFTDGGEFSMGAEMGISTQKLHARGPMGLKALTTTKYLITGTGQIRE